MKKFEESSSQSLRMLLFFWDMRRPPPIFHATKTKEEAPARKHGGGGYAAAQTVTGTRQNKMPPHFQALDFPHLKTTDSRSETRWQLEFAILRVPPITHQLHGFLPGSGLPSCPARAWLPVLDP